MLKVLPCTHSTSRETFPEIYSAVIKCDEPTYKVTGLCHKIFSEAKSVTM